MQYVLAANHIESHHGNSPSSQTHLDHPKAANRRVFPGVSQSNRLFDGNMLTQQKAIELCFFDLFETRRIIGSLPRILYTSKPLYRRVQGFLGNDTKETPLKST